MEGKAEIPRGNSSNLTTVRQIEMRMCYRRYPKWYFLFQLRIEMYNIDQVSYFLYTKCQYDLKKTMGHIRRRNLF